LLQFSFALAWQQPAKAARKAPGPPGRALLGAAAGHGLKRLPGGRMAPFPLPVPALLPGQPARFKTNPE